MKSRIHREQIPPPKESTLKEFSLLLSQIGKLEEEHRGATTRMSDKLAFTLKEFRHPQEKFTLKEFTLKKFTSNFLRRRTCIH
jgi:hypothetical protein